MKCRAIVLAWWFISVSHWEASPVVPVTQGPFGGSIQCEQYRTLLRELNTSVKTTPCWWDGK